MAQLKASSPAASSRIRRPEAFAKGIRAIAASTRQGGLAGYSNYGLDIALAAPGGDEENPIATLTVFDEDRVHHGHQLRRAAGGGDGGAGDGEGLESCTAEFCIAKHSQSISSRMQSVWRWHFECSVDQKQQPIQNNTIQQCKYFFSWSNWTTRQETNVTVTRQGSFSANAQSCTAGN